MLNGACREVAFGFFAVFQSVAWFDIGVILLGGPLLGGL